MEPASQWALVAAQMTATEGAIRLHLHGIDGYCQDTAGPGVWHVDRTSDGALVLCLFLLQFRCMSAEAPFT